MENEKVTGKLYKRDERIFFIYRNYLLSESLNDSKEVIHDEEYGFSPDQVKFIIKIIDSLERLEAKISEFLPKDWKWERFNVLEKAVILNGTAEILIAENSKPVVIDESIRFAKRYCGEKSQPLINGILDKIGK